MSKGDGRLFWRLGHLWCAYYGPTRRGAWGEIRQSCGTDDEAKARRFLQSRRREAANHREGVRRYVTPGNSRLTVGQLLDELLIHYRTRRIKSERQARARVRRLREHFGADRATAMTEARVEAYVTLRREQGAAEATIDRETEVLRRAFTLAKERGKVAFALRVPKLVQGQANARQGFVSREDFDRLLAELPSEVLRDVTLFGYATGMRRGEILSLTWDGYDRQTRTLRLAAGNAKSGRGRAIPLDGWPELRGLIERRLAARRLDSPLIFHGGRGRHVGDFYTTWVRARERAQIRQPFTFHDLRRTAVTNMLEAGVEWQVAKEISGHETDSMLKRYQIKNSRAMADAMRKRAEYEEMLAKK